MCPDVRRSSAGEPTSHRPHCGAARRAVTSLSRPACRSDVTGGGSRQKRRIRARFVALMVGDGWHCSRATSHRTRGNGLTGGSGCASGRNSSPRALRSIRQAAGKRWSHRPRWHLSAPRMWRLRTGFSGGRGSVRFTPGLLHPKWFSILTLQLQLGGFHLKTPGFAASHDAGVKEASWSKHPGAASPE